MPDYGPPASFPPHRARDGLHKRLEVVEHDPRIPRLMEIAEDYGAHKLDIAKYRNDNDERVSNFEKQVRCAWQHHAACAGLCVADNSGANGLSSSSMPRPGGTIVWSILSD